MKLKTIYTVFFSLLGFALIGLFSGYSFGPAATVGMGYTGAPGDVSGTTCATCHSGNAFGAVSISMTSEGNPPSYDLLDPTPIEITVSAASGMPAGYGIQLIALNVDDVPLDVTYSNLSANLKETTTPSGRKYLEHNGVGSNNVFTFDFQPNALSDLVPEIKFYVAANAVNGAAGNGGDSGSEGFMFSLRDIALAVELINFETIQVRNAIQLDWTTETEQDNEYFAVEHSTNGTDFATLKTIDGAGTTQERNTYAYVHDTPANGTNYYRLRMVEFSGKTTYSDIVVEKFIGAGTIAVYPQPVLNQAIVRIYADFSETALLEVHDLAGRMVSMKSIALEREENMIDLDCSDWATGHYIVTVSGAQLGQKSIRLMVK